jgi:hypothetical protein
MNRENIPWHRTVPRGDSGSPGVAGHKGTRDETGIEIGCLVRPSPELALPSATCPCGAPATPPRRRHGHPLACVLRPRPSPRSWPEGFPAPEPETPGPPGTPPVILEGGTEIFLKNLFISDLEGESSLGAHGELIPPSKKTWPQTGLGWRRPPPVYGTRPKNFKSKM